MTALTLSQSRDKFARIIGCCPDSDKVVSYGNEAQQRLLNRPNDPVGSWQRFCVCVNSSDRLVWPRQVRTIRSWWLCNQPGRFVSEFYESIGFSSGGVGLSSDTSGSCGGDTLIDQGAVCTFDNVQSSTALPKRIQAVASDTSDNGKTIMIRYVDSNSQRVYTNIDGVTQEGEQLTLSTAGVLTSAGAATGKASTGGIYHIVKAITNYPVRLYEWDVAGAVQTRLLAVFEPSETNPIYRYTKLPGLTNRTGCASNCDDSSVKPVVTITARLQHIPVIVDNDPYVIGNLPALADMVQAICYREKHMLQEALASEQNAARELDGEMSAYLGDGLITTVKTPDSSTWGPGNITNPCGSWGLYGGY